MTIPSFVSQAQAEQFAAEHAIKLTAADRDAIRKSQEAELSRLKSRERRVPGSKVSQFIEGLNQFYPRFLEALVGLGDILMTFTQTLIVSFGVPVVVLLLLIVEQQRVVHGIMLFEVDPGLAAFGAWALVVANLVLEFQIHHVEHKENFKQSSANQFSLRLWRDNIAYVLGLGRAWQVRTSSPAQRYRTLLRWVTITILTLALAGSMQSVITETEGAWYEAIVGIITKSNLSQMTIWLGGLLFATAAVLTAQGLSSYIALRTVEVRAQMSARQTDPENRYDAALEAVAIQYILAKVSAAQARREEKDAVGVASQPVPFSTNGRSGS